MRMPVIDFHSHILPGIDDGSKDVATSVEMLNMAAVQGVEWMIATPHFYASRDSLEEFLSRRQSSWEALMERLPEKAPSIRVGAEIAFFPGIGKAEALGKLTVEGTNLLLIEMPFAPWMGADVEEVKRILDRGFQVMIVHLERYQDIRENRGRIRELLELPVYVQINAGSLTDWRRRRQLIGMFDRGSAHFLGSDCHGIHHRQPNLLAGRDALRKKLGTEFLDRMDREGGRLLQI